MNKNTEYTDLGLIMYGLPNNSYSHKHFSLLNNFVMHRPFNQHLIFNSYNECIETLSVPILHVSQAKFFYGNLLALDMKSLLLAIECINCTNIYYYSTEIPWEKEIRPFSYWNKIFSTKNLNIIAQNQKINDIFELMWTKPLAKIEDLTYESISNIL
jgi:hypothetical protein